MFLRLMIILVIKKMAEQIKDDLESAKTYSRNNKGFELVIIGTHRDKADKYESKIDVLANELSQKYGGKCKIWDLTRACEQGKQVQKNLSRKHKDINDNSNHTRHIKRKQPKTYKCI